jgi:hypothetical protein
MWFVNYFSMISIYLLIRFIKLQIVILIPGFAYKNATLCLQLFNKVKLFLL